MSTIQVANVQLESTGNNRVQYLGSNTVAVVAGGANAIVANGTQVSLYANGTTGSSGQVLSTNGTSIFWGAASNVQTFAASGTWTKPASGTMALIQVWGGGGSGGANGGGGGGGGGFMQKIVLLSSLGSTETVTVGVGGAASNSTNNGSVGGTTTFGSWATAYGGGPGKAWANNGYGGEGGNPFAACVTNANGRPSFIMNRMVAPSSTSSGCPPSSSYTVDNGGLIGSGANRYIQATGGSISDHTEGIGLNGFGGGGGSNSISSGQSSYAGQYLIANSTAITGWTISSSAALRTNGAMALEGGSGGGAGKSTGAVATGGTGGGGGNGGNGGNTTVAATAGAVPGGGGGGGPQTSNSIAVSAAGGNGQCIVIVI